MLRHDDVYSFDPAADGVGPRVSLAVTLRLGPVRWSDGGKGGGVVGKEVRGVLCGDGSRWIRNGEDHDV